MDNLQSIPGTFCTSNAAATAGTTTTFTTTGTLHYCIKGKAFQTSAATNAATPTTDSNTGAAFVPVPVGKGSVFVLCYDGSSTTAATAIKVVQGSIESLDGSSADGAVAKFILAPQFPVIPDTLCPFAYVIVKVGTGGAAWTFGALNLAGPPSNVGIAFTSVMTLPGFPQVA